MTFPSRNVSSTVVPGAGPAPFSLRSLVEWYCVSAGHGPAADAACPVANVEPRTTRAAAAQRAVLVMLAP
jgi:hypothetical protein